MSTRLDRGQQILSTRRLMPVLLLVALITSVLAVDPAHAASAGSAIKSPLQAARRLGPAPAGFRAQLQAFYEQLARVGRENPGLNKRAKLIALGRDGELALSQLSSTQLAALYYETSLLPQWRKVPAELLKWSHEPYKAAKNFRPLDIVGGSTCVENGTVFPDPGLSAVIAAQDAAQVADIAVEITPDSAAEGLPDPLRIAGVAISKPLDLAATGVTNAHDLYTECSSDQQATLIQSISDNLASDTTNIRSDIANLKSDLDTGVTNIRSDVANLKSDLDTSVTNIRNDIASLKGDMDTRLTVIAGQITGVQSTLDQKMELRQIHIQVVTPPSGKHILVSTTEGGQPIDTTLVSIKVEGPGQASTFNDMTSQVTTSAPIPGVMDISFPGSNAAQTIYQIEVKETSTIDGQSVTHYGTIMAEQGS